MPLSFVIGIFVAQLTIATALGTALLYMAARCWRAPTISWRRAFALCLVLAATGLCGSIVLRGAVAVDITKSRAEILILVPSIILATFGMAWYWTKRFTRTGVARSLAIWLSAWIPLSVATLLIGIASRDKLLETFIVPTGSMAPNIIGVHGDRVCSNCGRPFAVSLSMWELPGGGMSRLERRPLSVACVNCREIHKIQIDTVRLRGDRVAVDKRTAPKRWSVVVFRKPPERKETHLKRLVGLPDETIELASGEVFINGKLLRKDPHTATELWLPVHDTRFVPKQLGKQTPHWRRQDDPNALPDANGAWTLKPETDERAVLEFAGEINDLLDYNDFGSSASPAAHNNLVGDVLLNCTISEIAGTGAIGLDWKFRGEQLTIEIRSGGNVSIQATSARDLAHQQVAASARLEQPVAAGDSLSFAVRDGQAYLLVNDVLAATTLFGPDNFEAFHGSAALPEQPCELSIWARGCSLALQHITLNRDVYYLGDASEAEAPPAPMRGGTGNPIELGATEYFVLADNSARGQDSRFYGDLQASDIVGVVRWIYWPISRWHEF